MGKNMSSQSRIIELVGPPGSGKTTLVNFFQKQNTNLEITIFPYFREISQVPFFAKSLLSLCPTLLHFYRNSAGKKLARRDIALMAILNNWNEVLVRRSLVSGRTIVMEEGAICLLAKLTGFGSEILKSEIAAAWWQGAYQKWARAIDVVVHLDTPIPTLLKRIRSRGVQFEIEKMSDPEALDYLTQIQAAQVNAISRLTAGPHSPQILRFSTTENSPEQICTEITRVLDRGH